tara:strand:- start:804 stop:1211 length:408 start_codon:yes stop_codon:yes gene_type:complete
MAKATPRSKCLLAIQLLARISAADDNGYSVCVSCGDAHHYKNMDGGHFIPKGASSYWALEVENVHPQCKGCNGFGMKYGSAAQSYTGWMIDTYGRDFVDDMIATKSNIKKMYKSDYDELTKQFKELIKYHEGRVC